MERNIYQPGLKKTILNRQIALPQDHGSWVFLLSPLLIGLFAGGSWSTASFFLIVSSIAGFLIRQPVTIIVKAYSGRRPERDLPAAYFWTGIYSLVGLAGVLGLFMAGYGFLLILAIPGIPVFMWHLYLVSRREERRQVGVELVGIGVLSLAAPAAYWIGQGVYSSYGWWLWALTWFQAAASIVYAYLRLEQRTLKNVPEVKVRLKMARRALAYTTFNFTAVTILSIAGVLPVLLPAAYAVQLLETIWGTFNPAVSQKPTRIGIRQLLVSTLFTVVFVLTWTYSF